MKKKSTTNENLFYFIFRKGALKLGIYSRASTQPVVYILYHELGQKTGSTYCMFPSNHYIWIIGLSWNVAE